jgi:hypothetical protein
MLTDAQRDVLRRLAEGNRLCCIAGKGANIYATAAGHLEVTDADMMSLEEAGLVEYDELDPWTWSYEITPAGRAAFGESGEEGE